MHDDDTVTADLDAFNEVRAQASRRRQLSLRAVVLGVLALALAAVTQAVVALPLLGVAGLCAAIVVRHEICEARRRRAVVGTLSRRWG